MIHKGKLAFSAQPLFLSSAGAASMVNVVPGSLLRAVYPSAWPNTKAAVRRMRISAYDTWRKYWP
jgi:hypothetical protein